MFEKKHFPKWKYQSLPSTRRPKFIKIMDRFEVVVHDDMAIPAGWPPMTWLSIKPLDGKEPTWAEMQQIKNRLIGPENEAVQVFPDESRLIDSCDKWHLWAFKDPSIGFPFGFNQGRIIIKTTARMPILVSFYTPEYVEAAARLCDDCIRLGIDHRIEAIAPQGDWLDNTRLKGPFVLRMLSTLNAPVLWVDADASLLRRPILFNGAACDFAAFPQTRNQHPWSVGTLYFAATDPARQLASRWAHWCENLKRESDEAALAKAWDEMKGGVQSMALPATYFSLKRGDTDVIIHRLSGNASKYNRRREI